MKVPLPPRLASSVSVQNTKTIPYKAILPGGPLAARARLVDLLSSPATRPGCPRLITIGASPYCEKVRWALDVSKLPGGYTEDAHPPGFSMLATLPASKGKASAVPMWVLPSGEAVWDSSAIMQRLGRDYPDRCGWLYPEALQKEVLAWEDYFDEVLGAPVRQLAYVYILNPKLRKRSMEIFSCGASLVEKGMLLYEYGFISGQMVITMKIRPEAVPALQKDISEVFANVDELLKDGRPFLFGEQMTAADITFAALSSQLICPPEMATFHPDLSPFMPPAMQQWVSALRCSPAGQHVTRLYSQHRGLGSSSRLVQIRGGGSRNRFPPAVAGALAVVGAAIAVGDFP
eukprot:RCo033800